jgi:Tfp pilus assembly protein PilF
MPSARFLLQTVRAIVLVYAFLAGLRMVTDFDLGWQMATGRWIVQHHQIPSTDVFSYTAPGEPWIYPVGSALLFYLTYLLGSWTLLSWLGAIVCTASVAFLLRRGSLVAAGLAVIAIPLIALHTTPRADMFTVLLFAIFLAILWQQHETGKAKLWLLPLLMVGWVNLHLGFVSGLVLLGAYAVMETLEMLWRDRRDASWQRLRNSLPWLVATVSATLVNPWGWGVYQALLRQNAATSEHSQRIIEWAATPLSWMLMAGGFSWRNTSGAFYTLLVIAALAVVATLLRGQPGAALLLGGAAWLSLRHVRFQAIFAVVLVIVGGAVLSSVLSALREHLREARLRSVLAVGASALVIALACLRSFDIVSDRTYLGTTDLGSFGAGLSWWFPDGAAAFLEHEQIPGEVFNTYNEGGYLVWRLGEKYRDYIDGRALPFGADLFERNGELLGASPDSVEWRREAERYNINAMVIPLARYNALQFFPVLPQFCASSTWYPVYLDEVSAVFLRRTPETEELIQRLKIDCNTVSIPTKPSAVHDSKSFNQWANAAALLQALGREAEAFKATTAALAIFPDSAFVHFLRGNLLRDAGNLAAAEPQYVTAASLEKNAATWSALADLYHSEGRLSLEIHSREQAAELALKPAGARLSLGYAYLDNHRPEDALRTFTRAEESLSADQQDASFLANVAHGRAMAWYALGDSDRAIAFEEETVRLSPDRVDDWLQLADLYERNGRSREAQKARERAEVLKAGVRY